MTEAEWLACRDVRPLLKCLGSKISERKFRLFGSACCRNIWNLLANDKTRRVVEIAEQVADEQSSAHLLGTVWYDAYCDLVSDDDADAAYNLGWGGIISEKRIFGKCVGDPDIGIWFYAWGIAGEAAGSVAESKGGISSVESLPVECHDDQAALRVDLYRKVFRQENDYQLQLLRCLFGNPFQPVNLDSSCLTSTVVALAQAIYQSRDFDHLPILADALEESGCDNTDILNHCRGPGPHVKGCWVVDVVLGKE